MKDEPVRWVGLTVDRVLSGHVHRMKGVVMRIVQTKATAIMCRHAGEQVLALEEAVAVITFLNALTMCSVASPYRCDCDNFW